MAYSETTMKGIVMFKTLKDVVAGRKSVTITVQETAPIRLSPSQMMDRAMNDAFDRSRRMMDVAYFSK